MNKLFSCTAEHLHCLTLAFQSGKLSPHQSLLQNVSITVCLNVSLPVIWGSNVSSFMPLCVLFLHTSFSYPVSTCEGLLTFLVCHVVWKVIFSHFLEHAEIFLHFFFLLILEEHLLKERLSSRGPLALGFGVSIVCIKGRRNKSLWTNTDSLSAGVVSSYRI